MAGFINKKKKLIDYKLTEHGRNQTASGDISFKYYTFSDSSIVYHEKTNISNDNKISDSEFYYLPLEVTTDPGNYFNPEFYLTNELTFSQDTNNLLFETNLTQKTLSKSLIDKKYLSTKFLNNSFFNDDSRIVFDILDIKDNFDFKNSTLSRKYPTVLYLEESLSNLVEVKKDPRFFKNKKFKKMSPININGTQVIDSTSEEFFNKEDELKSPVNYVYKTLDIKNNISTNDSLENIISSLVDLINENKEKFYYLDYNLNNSFIKENDAFVFEIHEIKNNSLNKLPFVKIGEFYDKKNKKYITVFLIGKFIKKRNIKSNFNSENSVSYLEMSNDYYFVNLFTLVVE